MKFYRKQTIEAEQFDGSTEMIERYDMGFQLAPNGKGGAIIRTLEGDLLVHVGDWIVNEADEIKVLTDEEFQQQYAGLPVIPKSVAECIINGHFLNQLAPMDGGIYRAMIRTVVYGYQKDSVGDWIINNSDMFARAWLDGYVVEE